MSKRKTKKKGKQIEKVDGWDERDVLQHACHNQRNACPEWRERFGRQNELSSSEVDLVKDRLLEFHAPQRGLPSVLFEEKKKEFLTKFEVDPAYKPGPTRRLISADVARNSKTGKSFERHAVAKYCDLEGDGHGEGEDFEYTDKNSASTDIWSDKIDRKFEYRCECDGPCNTTTCKCVELNVEANKTCIRMKDGLLEIEDPRTDMGSYALFTCGSLCGCPPSCPNRIRNVIGQNTFELFRRDPVIGFGVRTLNSIPFGQIVTEFVGEVEDMNSISRESDDWAMELASRKGQHHDIHSIVDGLPEIMDVTFGHFRKEEWKQAQPKNDYSYYIDPRKKGGLSRFITHGCWPNLQPLRVISNKVAIPFHRIFFYACSAIPPGSELFFDYGADFKERLTCLCSTPFCKTDNEYRNFSREQMQEVMIELHRHWKRVAVDKTEEMEKEVQGMLAAKAEAEQWEAERRSRRKRSSFGASLITRDIEVVNLSPESDDGGETGSEAPETPPQEEENRRESASPDSASLPLCDKERPSDETPGDNVNEKELAPPSTSVQGGEPQETQKEQPDDKLSPWDMDFVTFAKNLGDRKFKFKSPPLPEANVNGVLKRILKPHPLPRRKVAVAKIPSQTEEATAPRQENATERIKEATAFCHNASGLSATVKSSQDSPDTATAPFEPTSAPNVEQVPQPNPVAATATKARDEDSMDLIVANELMDEQEASEARDNQPSAGGRAVTPPVVKEYPPRNISLGAPEAVDSSQPSAGRGPTVTNEEQQEPRDVPSKTKTPEFAQHGPVTVPPVEEIAGPSHVISSAEGHSAIQETRAKDQARPYTSAELAQIEKRKKEAEEVLERAKWRKAALEIREGPIANELPQEVASNTGNATAQREKATASSSNRLRRAAARADKKEAQPQKQQKRVFTATYSPTKAARRRQSTTTKEPKTIDPPQEVAIQPQRETTGDVDAAAVHLGATAPPTFSLKEATAPATEATGPLHSPKSSQESVTFAAAATTLEPQAMEKATTPSIPASEVIDAVESPLVAISKSTVDSLKKGRRMRFKIPPPPLPWSVEAGGTGVRTSISTLPKWRAVTSPTAQTERATVQENATTEATAQMLHKNKVDTAPSTVKGLKTAVESPQEPPITTTALDSKAPSAPFEEPPQPNPVAATVGGHNTAMVARDEDSMDGIVANELIDSEATYTIQPSAGEPSVIKEALQQPLEVPLPAVMCSKTTTLEAAAATVPPVEETPPTSPAIAEGHRTASVPAVVEVDDDVMVLEHFVEGQGSPNTNGTRQPSVRVRSATVAPRRHHGHPPPNVPKKIARVAPMPRVDPEVIEIDDEEEDQDTPLYRMMHPQGHVLHIWLADLLERESSDEDEDEPEERQEERNDDRGGDVPQPANGDDTSEINQNKDGSGQQHDDDIEIVYSGPTVGIRPPAPKRRKVAEVPPTTAGSGRITVKTAGSARAQNSPIFFGPQRPTDEPPPGRRSHESK